MTKSFAILLLAPILACSQTNVNLKPPPAAQVQVPNGVIERLHLDNSTATRDGAPLIRPITITAGSVTFTLTKQPAPNQVIMVSLGLMVQKFIPDPTQTLLNQKTLVIMLPDPPYSSSDPVVISYLTLETVP